MFWFIKSSIMLDIGFVNISDWTLKRKFEFLIKKYIEIFLLISKIKKFKLSHSFMILFGKKIYYDSPYGIAGYESMLARHQKMLKRSNVKNVRIVVDIGANVGFFSLMVKNLFPKAKVFVVEPIPLTFKCLEKNLNEKDYRISNLAISDKNGFVRMKFDKLQSAFSHVVSNTEKSFNKSLSIPCVTLDKFCLDNNIDKIDLLKIDTESFEANVLRGAVKTLEKTRYLSIEISIEKNSNYTFSEINSLLYSQNYNFQLICFRNYTDKGAGPIPVGDFLYKNEKYK